MKKIAMALILATFLISGNVKPAEALIVDPLQLATKVSGYLETIKESVEKVTQQINQIKMTITQGFTIEGLKKLAGQYISVGVLERAVQVRMSKIEANAKKKKVKEQEDKMKWDQATKLRMYNDKLDIANKDMEILENTAKEVNTQIQQKGDECLRLKNEADAETDENEWAKKNAAYEACDTELEDLKDNEKEQYALIKQYKEGIKDLEKTIKEVEKGDEDYKNMEAMLKATKDAKDSEKIIDVQVSDKEEWDNKDAMKKFHLDEKDYQEFVNRYFYDPTSVKGEGREGMKDYQSKMDRVMRERRFLLVNTAVHLLQVATSARREIPVREHNLEAYSNFTSEGKDELEAASAYAATRIENAKTLLLYARVLSAKLQYIAARDLLNETLAKEIKDPVTGQEKKYKEFDLGKYILTPEFVKYKLEQANPAQDLVDQVE